jgi:hypothetical protein
MGESAPYNAVVFRHRDSMFEEGRVGVDESPEEPRDTSEAEVSDDVIVRAAHVVQNQEEDFFWQPVEDAATVVADGGGDERVQWLMVWVRADEHVLGYYSRVVVQGHVGIGVDDSHEPVLAYCRAVVRGCVLAMARRSDNVWSVAAAFCPVESRPEEGDDLPGRPNVESRALLHGRKERNGPVKEDKEAGTYKKKST